MILIPMLKQQLQLFSECMNQTPELSKRRLGSTGQRRMEPKPGRHKIKRKYSSGENKKQPVKIKSLHRRSSQKEEAKEKSCRNNAINISYNETSKAKTMKSIARKKFHGTGQQQTNTKNKNQLV